MKILPRIIISTESLLFGSVKKSLIQFALICLCTASSTALADVPFAQVTEVNHLLIFIKKSGCIINRNRTDHAAEKGLEHIKKKYDHFRNDIKSTEDFIDYSATRSTMSGDYYMVKCPGSETIKTQDWLMAELKRFRAELIICEEPRPQICTHEYNPVCAKMKDGSTKTGSTGCTSCSDTEVVGYKMGAC